MPLARRSPLSRILRIVLLVVGILLVAAAGVISLGKDRIAANIEQRVRDRLKARGLEPGWSEASWNLWKGGVVFRDFTLRETVENGRQVLAVDRLAVRMPPSEWISAGHRSLVWSVPKSRVVVADEAGEIVIEEAAARFETRRGRILIKEAKGRHKGLVVDLEGEITTRMEPLWPPPRFVMRLKAARATLNVLDFGDGEGRFKVRGNFTVDASNPAFNWTATLKGHGKDVVLKGVPLRDAGATADLSSTAESVINAGVSTAHGRAEAVIRRDGWKGTPFTFAGALEDQRKGKSRFEGKQHQGVFQISKLEGTADLWSIASDVPMVADGMPSSVRMESFPPVTATGIRWKRDEGWSVARAATTGEGSVTISHDGKKVGISALTGTASLDGKKWSLKEVRGEVFGGRLSVDGSYSGGSLNGGTIKGDGLSLARIKQTTGKGRSATPGVLAFSYSGSADLGAKQFTGEGRMTLENAPVIEVPLLDQVHDLFASIIPGVKRSEQGEGRFEAHFTSKGSTVDVGSFEAKGGTLVVDARGQVDLKEETVMGSARGKLTGLPGVATSPLSRLLEMEVGGSLDKIQVRRLEAVSIISNAAKGTADAVEDVIKGGEEREDSPTRKSPRGPAKWFEKWKQERR